jgi:acetyl-CoA synthetase
VVLGKDPGDITTIEDEGSVEEAREAWREMQADLAAGARTETGPQPGV